MVKTHPKSMKSPADVLPLYHRLTKRERLWMRWCFTYSKSAEKTGKPSTPKSMEQRLDEATYLLRKSFGGSFFDGLDGKTVLDLGCGEGNQSMALARANPNAMVTGIDLQQRFEEMREYAHHHNVNNIAFSQTHSDTLTNASFDVVFSHDSFEHFDDPVNMLKEMTRLCKADGQIFIKFGPTWMGPYGRHMFNVFRKDRPWMHLIIPERSVMRIYSVIKRKPVLYERYVDYPDGLNKMTVARAKSIMEANTHTKLKSFNVVSYLDGRPKFKRLFGWLLNIPLLNELLSQEVSAVLRVNTSTP